MTWRCVWDLPGTPFPAWVDHDDEASAHLFALRKSREIRGEVAVVEIEGAMSRTDAWDRATAAALAYLEGDA